MINYYALWIPSCKEEVPNIQREGLDEVVLQDIPESVTKNIHNLRHFLHEGYNVKREMDYCNFLLDRHQAVIGDETCMKIQQAYQDFLTYYTDLDFWYHAYLDTISFSDSKVSKRWGITGGILGLLSIAITLFLEYRPSKSESLDTQLLKSDSLMQVRQDSLIRKVDLLINSSQSDILKHNTPSKDPAIRQ